MFWLVDRLDRIERTEQRELEILGQMSRLQQQMNARLITNENTINAVGAEIISKLNQIIAIFSPRPFYVVITSEETMPLTVGQSSTLTVTVLDQFGQPFPGFDFAANPPQWSVSDPAQDSLAAGSTPDTESITATAPGSQTVSVTVPGVTNGSASLSFTNAQAAAVPSSVQIVSTPDISG